MSSDNCLIITHYDFIAGKVVTVVLNTLVCLMCIPAAAIIVFLKAYKKLIPRLLLILVASAFLYMLLDELEVLTIQYEGPHNGTGSIVFKDSTSKYLCIICGWLDNFIRLIATLIICWIALHLLLSLHGKNCCIKEHWVYVIGLASSLLVSVIPLIPLCPGKTIGYGLMGLGCGFTDLNSSCHHSECELLREVVLFYIPCLVAFVFILGTLCYMIMKLCLKARKRDQLTPTLQVHYKRALEGTWILTITIIIVAMIGLVLLISHMFIHNRSKHGASINLSVAQDWLWDAAFEPALFAVAPFAILVTPGTIKKLRWSELKLAATRWMWKEEDHCETHFTVTGHCESSREEERLIITGNPASRENITTYGINEN